MAFFNFEKELKKVASKHKKGKEKKKERKSKTLEKVITDTAQNLASRLDGGRSIRMNGINDYYNMTDIEKVRYTENCREDAKRNFSIWAN